MEQCKRSGQGAQERRIRYTGEGVEVVFCPDGWNANRKGPSRGKCIGGEVKTQFVLKQDLLSFFLSFFQTENNKFLHSAEGEILRQVLEWARNNPSRCGPVRLDFCK